MTSWPLRRLLLPLLVASALGACQGPEVVVGQAVDAARAGDREAYAACFTPRSRGILETWWQAVDAHNPPLGVLSAGEVRITSVQRMPSRGRDGERALITVAEDGDELGLVLHHSAGVWRIDLLDTERATLGISSF